MITNRPCAASIPPIKAAPYPRSAIRTNRAPSALAIAGESSVLPLSATTTSPAIPAFLIAASAFRMHVASVSASLRQGITTVTSSGVTSHTSPRRRGNLPSQTEQTDRGHKQRSTRSRRLGVRHVSDIGRFRPRLQLIRESKIVPGSGPDRTFGLDSTTARHGRYIIRTIHRAPLSQYATWERYGPIAHCAT